MDDSINIYRSQVVVNAFHLFVAGAKASLLPFLTLFFRYLGLSATQTGIVIAVKASLPMITTPLWLVCASKCQRKRFVLMMSVFVVMFSALILSLVPAEQKNMEDFCLPKSIEIHRPNANMTESETESIAFGVEQSNDTFSTHTPSKGFVSTLPSSTNLSNLQNISSTTVPVLNAETVKSSTTLSTASTSKMSPEDSGLIDIYRILLSQSKDKLEKLGYDENDITHMSPQDLADLMEKLIAEIKDTSTLPSTTKTEPDAKVNLNGHKTMGENEKDTGDASDNNDTGGLSDADIKVLLENGIDEEFIDSVDPDLLAEALHKILASEKESKKSGRKKRNAASSPFEKLNEKLSKLQDSLSSVENAAFTIVLAIVIFSDLCSCSIDKLADRLWFDFTDGIDMLEKYGPHKSWTFLGWVFMPVVVAGLVDSTDCTILNGIYHFNIHFYIFSAFMGLAFIFSLMFPMLKEKKRIQRHTSVWKGFKIICGDIRGFAFCVSLIILGATSAGIDNFLMWRIQDIGGTEVTLGGAISLGGFTSLVIHILLRWIVYKLTNAGATILALFALALRLIIYAYLPAPWVVLAIGFLQGFSHTLLLGAIETYPDFKVNPYIMDRSAKSVASGLYMSVAYAGGSLVSGIVYDLFGLSLLYIGGSIVAVGWCIIFALIFKFTKRSKKMRYARLLQAEEDQITDESDDDDEDWLATALKHEK